MRKRLCIILLAVLLLGTMGCETKTAVIEPVVKKMKVIPFSERKFVYHNGLKLDHKKVETVDKENVKVVHHYQVISGLKNKTVQDRINKELVEVSDSLFAQLDSDLYKVNKLDNKSIEQKNSSAYISYNINNVMFVEFNASIVVKFNAYNNFPSYRSVTYGYDLNTGERIFLKDIFKQGIDYKAKINQYISHYLIENNYDDYSAELMSKPFQGIKENQSFSFGFEGLRIIFNDEDDEFFNEEHIWIPLKYLGDDLDIFDKYFDENSSIFEGEKLYKKLFPNNIEFRANKMIRDYDEDHYIEIIQGEFINIPNKNVANKLNEMIMCKLDIEKFKEQAASNTGKKSTFHYFYTIETQTNAGGYLSIVANEEIFAHGIFNIKRTPFNYDLNLNKELLLEDLFVPGTDYVGIIKNYIRKMDYPISDEMLEKGVDEAVKSKNFYFNEHSIVIYFSPADAALNSEQKWVWIPVDEIGMEHMRLLN